MSSYEELAWLDATALAKLIRDKQITPQELLDDTVKRIERLNPQLNAVVTPMYDLAQGAADEPLCDGPFAGVPFLLKDLLAIYQGVRLTAGCALLKDYVPDHDSELVKRQKRAGLIHVGKTNTPEWGLMPTTESDLLGRCSNPWDLDRTPGGSSGGSAAAVAAGIVPMAHANDGGGSIRIPASCCGLFGLKPTRARNPLGPGFGDMMGGLVAEHAVTRSVRDSATLLDTTAGPEPGDPYWPPPLARPMSKEVGTNPGVLRIAFSAKTMGDVEVHPDCIAAVQSSAKLCEELGHQVEEAAPVISAAGSLPLVFGTIWSAGLACTLDGIAMMTGQPIEEGQVEPMTWALYQKGLEVKASKYMLAIQTAQRVAREVAAFFENYDVWLTPTLAKPPVPLGWHDPLPDDPLRGWRRSAQFAPFTPICNLTGQPAMSVPLFWNEGNLPIGSHFVGRFGDEATLFRLAAQLEQARPWAQRRPPVSA
ncbi:MAG: amidase [Desulfarculus sp.]|nr:amidase [Pseudomonadota bacterium]MBU4575976.1 amidase [Pseudomonadota bacterium]MBU4599443.1 amidase [Pseudomonadota bacterium]MBV1717084.1 amidase [Desulfarculus sp.]MBV1737731.1 amidase [Desulfarculus sp.]